MPGFLLGDRGRTGPLRISRSRCAVAGKTETGSIPLAALMSRLSWRRRCPSINIALLTDLGITLFQLFLNEFVGLPAGAKVVGKTPGLFLSIGSDSAETHRDARAGNGNFPKLSRAAANVLEPF